MSQFLNSRENAVTEAIDGMLMASAGALSRLDGYPHIRVVLDPTGTNRRSRLSRAADPAMSRPMPVSSDAAC
jgi:hypothetical protein